MILRDANPGDIPALSRLASEAFIAKFGHLYSAENLNLFLGESLSEAAIAVENNDDFIRQPSLFRKPLLAQRERLPPESRNHDRDLVLISLELQRSPS